MFMLILRGFAGAAMDRPIWEVTLVVLWWRCHICHHNPDLGHFHWSSPATCLSPEPPLASHASPLAATRHPAAGQWNPSRALWKWSCMAWNIWKGLLSLSLIRITCFFLLWHISVNRWFLKCFSPTDTAPSCESVTMTDFVKPTNSVTGKTPLRKVTPRVPSSHHPHWRKIVTSEEKQHFCYFLSLSREAPVWNLPVSGCSLLYRSWSCICKDTSCKCGFPYAFKRKYLYN